MTTIAVLQVDPDTGELHFFGYNIMHRPYCTYSVADAAGKRIKSVPIDVPDPVMMHDFAITTNYAIFVDCPLVFNPEVRDRVPPRHPRTAPPPPLVPHRRPASRRGASIKKSLRNTCSCDVQVMVRKGVVPFEYKVERGARVGLLRRDFVNGERTQWFTLPSFMAFHIVRACLDCCSSLASHGGIE